MQIKIFLTIALSVFLAELGDKTQLATMLYASDAKTNKWLVFAASASALVVCSALGVILGSFIGNHIPPKLLSTLAGLGFIGVGVWTLLK